MNDTDTVTTSPEPATPAETSGCDTTAKGSCGCKSGFKCSPCLVIWGTFFLIVMVSWLFK